MRLPMVSHAAVACNLRSACDSEQEESRVVAPEEDIAHVLGHICQHPRGEVQRSEHAPAELRLQVWAHHEQHLHTIKAFNRSCS